MLPDHFRRSAQPPIQLISGGLRSESEAVGERRAQHPVWSTADNKHPHICTRLHVVLPNEAQGELLVSTSVLIKKVNCLEYNICSVDFRFSEPCIVIYKCKKKQQNVHFIH